MEQLRKYVNDWTKAEKEKGSSVQDKVMATSAQKAKATKAWNKIQKIGAELGMTKQEISLAIMKINKGE